MNREEWFEEFKDFTLGEIFDISTHALVTNEPTMTLEAAGFDTIMPGTIDDLIVVYEAGWDELDDDQILRHISRPGVFGKPLTSMDRTRLLRLYREMWDRTRRTAVEAQEKLAVVSAFLTPLGHAIKTMALQDMRSLEGSGVKATYEKAYWHVTYPTALIEAYAAAHPAIRSLADVTQVKASVSIEVAP